MELTFNTHGNEKQKEAVRIWNDHETTVFAYGGSKMSGKTYLGCSLISGDALIYPDTAYFIARKSLNDLRKFTKQSMLEVLRNMQVREDYYKFDAKDNFFHFYNDSYIYLLEGRYRPEDPDFYRYGSLNMTRGMLEEGGEFTTKAFTNLFATVGRKNNDKYNLHPKLIITCNPSKNFLYPEFYKKHKEGKLEGHKKFIQALPTDNKKMTRQYYQHLLNELKGTDKERLLFGNWEYGKEETELIDGYEDILNLFDAFYIAPDFKGGYLVTDLSRKGRDRYLLVHVTGNPDSGVCIRFLDDKVIANAKQIEKDIRLYRTAFAVKPENVISDADGLGQYLGDYLEGLTEFHGQAKAENPDRYTDIKSQCGYFLANLVNSNLLRIIAQDSEQEERIKIELPYLRAKLIDTDASKLELIKKPDIKALLGHSPDYLDVLIMSMLPFVRPKTVYRGIIDVGY